MAGSHENAGLSVFLVTYAGVAAEARQRRHSSLAVAMTSGYGDLQDCSRAIKFVADDREDELALHRAAEEECRRFVRNPVMWDAIKGIADLLQLCRRVESDDPDVIAITDCIDRIDVADLKIPGTSMKVYLDFQRHSQERLKQARQ